MKTKFLLLLIIPATLLSGCGSKFQDQTFTKTNFSVANSNGGTWDGILTEDAENGEIVEAEEDGTFISRWNFPKYTPKYLVDDRCQWTRIISVTDGDTFNVEWVINKHNEIIPGPSQQNGYVSIRLTGYDTEEISDQKGVEYDLEKGMHQSQVLKDLLPKGTAVCLIPDDPTINYVEKSYNRYLRYAFIDMPLKIVDTDPYWKTHTVSSYESEVWDKYKGKYTLNIATYMVAVTGASADCGRFTASKSKFIIKEIPGCVGVTY